MNLLYFFFFVKGSFEIKKHYHDIKMLLIFKLLIRFYIHNYFFFFTYLQTLNTLHQIRSKI